MAGAAFPWPGALVALAVAGVSAAGLGGLWAPWGERWIGTPMGSLLLLALSLGPLAFYALALERGKPAPALRGALAPWVLFAALHLGVQLSGGPASPLQAAYPLLLLFLARHAGTLSTLAVAVLLTALSGLPLAQASQDGATVWPQALQLALPWLGMAAGQLSRAVAAAPRRKAPDAAVAAPQAALLPVQPEAPLDSAQLLQRELESALQVFHAAFSQVDAVTLWWGSPQEVRLQQGVLRRGELALGAVVLPGESLLGLVLREQRPLSVEPLSAGAAAELPYRREATAVQCLRVLPLSDEGQLVGLLAVDKTDASEFSADERTALDALARQVVHLAQRAAYLARLQAQGGRTQRLYAAAQALGANLDREALLERFGQLLQTLVPCDSWALGMREGDEPAPLMRVASHAYLASAPAELGWDKSSSLAGSLAQAEGALLFNRAEGAQVPAVLQAGLLTEAQHFLLAPLHLGGRLNGVLKLDRQREPFSEEDRELAFIFASQAAVTLEHARLYTLHRRLATTDGLTGLYNHRYFQERLALELEKAERTGKPLSLALTDIDHFKGFNDTFGHQEGDVVLRKVADLVRDKVRQGQDVVARYGGEEFVVILPECDVVEARQVMDRLREHCATTMVGGSGPEARAITISIGLCTYPQGAKEQRELIHVADSALYKAKHAGRNQVCSYKDL
jgi:diguanylate cyclase (GGDEF)-like protein